MAIKLGRQINPTLYTSENISCLVCSWCTSKFILLPELKIVTHWQSDKFRTRYKCMKESEFEICPKCASKCTSVHDRRWVKIEDQPIRGSGVTLEILKHRIGCGFTAPRCRPATRPTPFRSKPAPHAGGGRKRLLAFCWS